ncbi:MAG: type II secretion system protein [Planctomycetia bacterium]|nr:type II secretion system protein [Planctomycetia bacterium]
MRRGFTLLEILVVLALLITGMTLLSSLSSAALREAVRSEEQATVILFCRSQLNAILIGAVPCRNGHTWQVPDAESWLATVTIKAGPLPNLSVVQLTAQKYEEIPEPTQDGKRFTVSRIPVVGGRVQITQWIRTSALEDQHLQESPSAGDQEEAFIGSLQFLPGDETETDLFQDAGFPAGDAVEESGP